MINQSKLEDFYIQKRLGEGSFGSVYLVQRKSDQKLYAMKKVKMLSLSTKEKENALNEIRILASIKNPNVIRYKDAFYDDCSSFLCIIMEYAAKGDILGMINESKKKKQLFDEETVWKYASDMLLGLKSLHDQKIIHRDLKGANIFITETGSLKLGDLNVSKVSKQDFAQTQTGTPYYTAPEIWQNRKYDYKCDVWSFGCVLYEIVTLEPPFKGISMEDLYKKVLKGFFQPINQQKYTNDLQKFIESCIKLNPNQRESVDNLLKHKNISKFFDQKQLFQENKNYSERQSLLQTIKLPIGGNLKGINQKLPKPMYDGIETKINEDEEFKQGQDQIIFKKAKPQSAHISSSNQKPSNNNVVVQANQCNQVGNNNNYNQNYNNNIKNVINYDQKQNQMNAQQNQRQVNIPPINNPNNYYSPNIVVTKQRQLSAQPAGLKRYQSNDAIYVDKYHLPSVENNNNYHYNQYNRPVSRDNIASRNSQERQGYRKQSENNLENNKNFVNENSKPKLNYQNNNQRYNQPIQPSKLLTPQSKNNYLPPKPNQQRPY